MKTLDNRQNNNFILNNKIILLNSKLHLKKKWGNNVRLKNISGGKCPTTPKTVGGKMTGGEDVSDLCI